MRISGLQKLSMVDFPQKIAATVFTGGCNWRCPFCHNTPLVLLSDETPTLSQESVLSFLASRRGLLDGVVLSGGEPLLQPGVTDFLAEVHALGFAIKVDTNGCYPKVLSDILQRGLADYIAMDIKNSPQRYGETVGVPGFDLTPVQESIDLLRTAGIPYEFRTTLVRELHTTQDLEAIGRWVGGAPQYFLQQFVDSGNILADGFHAFSEEEMHAMAEVLRPFFPVVAVRGV